MSLCVPHAPAVARAPAPSCWVTHLPGERHSLALQIQTDARSAAELPPFPVWFSLHDILCRPLSTPGLIPILWVSLSSELRHTVQSFFFMQRKWLCCLILDYINHPGLRETE